MTTPEEIEKFEEWFSFCFKDEDLPIEETILKLKKFVFFFTTYSDKLIELISDLEQRRVTQIAENMFKEADKQNNSHGFIRKAKKFRRHRK